MRLGVVVALVVMVMAVSGCGALSDEVTSREEPVGLLDDQQMNDVEFEFFDFMVQIGATEQEATCIARQLAAGAETFEEANDRTASYDSLTHALEALAPDCASAERYRELEAGDDEAFVPGSEQVAEAQAKLFAAPFLSVGATEDEARCMADVLASIAPEEIPPIYGSYDSSSAELVIFEVCGAPERVAELYRDAYRLPLEAQFLAAGATGAEASCILDAIDQIDLFLPSEDFHGEGAALVTADLFARDAKRCGGEGRLRQIALNLHVIYEAGD